MREIPQPLGTLKELSMVRAGRRAQQIDPTRRNGVLCGRREEAGQVRYMYLG